MLDRPISPSRRAYIGVMGLLCALSVLLVCALALFLIGYVLAEGLPNLSWELLTTKPSYLSDTIGILPDILNTIYIILAVLLIVLPVGAGAAVYLTEYAANKRLVSVIEYAAETLSGIPSIIYGLVGMLVFTSVFGTSLLAGALTLVMMNLPTVMRTTQESLRTVPQSYREGAFGLGAGKWRVIRTVVLPGCAARHHHRLHPVGGAHFGGIGGAVIYSGIRSCSERLSQRPGQSGSHPYCGVVPLHQGAGPGGAQASFAIAAILMALTLTINFAAVLVGRIFKKGERYEQYCYRKGFVPVVWDGPGTEQYQY